MPRTSRLAASINGIPSRPAHPRPGNSTWVVSLQLRPVATSTLVVNGNWTTRGARGEPVEDFSLHRFRSCWSAGTHRDARCCRGTGAPRWRPVRESPRSDRTLRTAFRIHARRSERLHRLRARRGSAGCDPLYSKVREGVFRSADDARVIAAVQRLGRDLAESALGDSAVARRSPRGANALRAGQEAGRTVAAAGRAWALAATHPAHGRAGGARDLATRATCPPAMAAASVNESS